MTVKLPLAIVGPAIVLFVASGGLAFDDQAPPPDATGEIRRELDDIFAQAEFRRLRHMQEKDAPAPSELTIPDWLRRLLRWLLGGAKAVSGMGALWQMLAYTALAIVCCLIIWLVVRAVNNYRHYHDERLTRSLRPEEGQAEIPPGDLPADEYLRRADELVRQSMFREAVGQLILGAMSRVERAGLIRFRRGLTHRDYLRSLRSQGTTQQAFRTLVAIYEPICFGRREARLEHFETALAAYRSGFDELLSSAAAA